MNSVDFASFLNVSGVTGATTNNVGNSSSASPFSEYLRKVNYKIDSAENKLISDYKAKYIENTPAKSNTESLNQSSKFVQYQNNDRASQKRAQSAQRSVAQTDTPTGKSVIDNRVNPYAVNNSQSSMQSQSNQSAPRVQESNNIGEVKTLRGSDVLTPQTDAKVNLVSKVVLANQVDAGSAVSDELISDPSQDLAVEDNFLLASLVYKVFNIMNDSGAVDGTPMQGSSLKDFMEIIKQLPQDKLNELRTLIDPENLDITAEDKANVNKIKDILLATNYVIADSSDEASTEIAPARPEGFGKVDESKINEMVSQMLAENGLVNNKQATVNVVSDTAEDGLNTTVSQANNSAINDMSSKVDIKSIRAIVEQIRKEKAEEELEKLRRLLGITDDEDGSKLEKALKGTDDVADSKESSSKQANITDELLNRILAKIKGVATNLEDVAKASLKDEILKLMNQGMSDEEIVEVVAPMIEDDDKLFSDLVDRLVADVELKDGNFVKVDKDAVIKSEVAQSNQQSNSNELLKNLINSNKQQASTDIRNLEADSKVTAKDVPQVTQNLPTKTDAKPEAENKANLMKSYEELKLQIEKVVNASSGGNSKGEFSQADKQPQSSLLATTKPNTESQLKELTGNNLAQSKSTDSSLDFNTQLKNLSDAKSDKPQQMVDAKQSAYNVKDPKDVLRLFKTLEQSMSKGESKVTVSLTPENLGKMEIRLVENAGKITAKFYTESEASHKLIMSQADLFKNQLSEKGITIDNMEFSFNDPSAKQGKDSDRKTAKNSGRKDTEEGGIIERDKNINFRSKASRAGGLYA